MNAFWDTSAVLGLALQDSCCHEARRTLAADAWHHVTSPLVAFEAENRIRNMQTRGELSADESREAMHWLEHLFGQHYIRLQNVKDSRLIAAEGQRMIRHFSTARPHKPMDIIHVACARLLRAEGFFTFDSNQSALAAAAGFTVKLT